MGWIQEFSKRGTIRARESGEASPQWVQGKALVVDLMNEVPPESEAKSELVYNFLTFFCK